MIQSTFVPRSAIAVWIVVAASLAPRHGVAEVSASLQPRKELGAQRVTDHAVWVAAVASRLRLGYRAEVPLALGAELGWYPIRYLRLASRFLVASTPVRDGCYPDVAFMGGSQGELGYVFCQPSRSARFGFALSVGAVVVDTSHWAIAPGLVAVRTDVADYGTALGVGLPIDWQPRRGLKLGIDVALGAAIGQHISLRCVPMPMSQCTPGTVVTGPNLDTWSALAAVSVGWTFDLRSDAR